MTDASKTQGPLPTGPLCGIRVLDMTHMLAGPYCTWTLGALGAEVTKVERPGSGDFTRELAPKTEGESLYFLSVNRNKRSITLDLKDPRGRAVFVKLIERTDIFVENNRAGVMDRLGLGWEDLRKINPRLIFASISGFGQTGPYRDKPCFDAIAQAMSGMMSVTGEANGPPARVGVSIGDMGASLFTSVGILAALERRHATGQGGFVDVAMLDSQLALLENAAARWLNAGDLPRRIGSRHPLVAPFQAFATLDEPIAVCVDTNDQWRRLCTAMELPELLADPRFPDGSTRARNHAELEPLLQAGFSRRTRADWLARLEAADVPSSPINSVADALADPQVRSRDMVVEVPEGSNRRFVALPIRLDGAGAPAETPAPRLGQHTDAILAELGYAADEIAALRGAKIV